MLVTSGRGVSPTTDRVDGSPRPSRGRLVAGNRGALLAGVAVAAVVLSPPTEGLVHESLAAHMIQHVIVIGVVAPLVALGSPTPSRAPRPGLLAAWLTAGVVTQTALVLVWHAPPLFDAAEHTPVLHAFEHLCLFAGAWLLWWVAARLGGPAGRGPGALAVFVSLLPMTVLGVGMTFARTPWYHHHDDLVDQQTGGVVMWAGGGLLALVGAVALGVSWVGAASATATTDPTPAGPARPTNIPAETRPS